MVGGVAANQRLFAPTLDWACFCELSSHRRWCGASNEDWPWPTNPKPNATVDYFNGLIANETDENRRLVLLRLLEEAEKLRQEQEEAERHTKGA